MKKYFIHVNGYNAGPYSFEELRMMNISQSTPVWFQGLGDWKTAGEIPELKSLFQPPSFYQPSTGYIPPNYGMAQNYSSPLSTDYVPPARTSTAKILIVVGSIFLVLLAGVIFATYSYREKRRQGILRRELLFDSIMKADSAMMVQQQIDAPSGDDLRGDYYNYSGGDLSISGDSNDNLQVTLHFKSTTGTDCSGDITGTGRWDSYERKIIVSTSSGCEITLQDSGNGGSIIVSETSDCTAYHGQNCNFGGMYFKR